MNSYQFIRKPIAEALYLALLADPFYRALERSVSDDSVLAKEAMLRYFDYSMMEGHRYGELVIPDGETWGASIWSKPVDEELTNQISLEKKLFLLQDMGSDCLRIYQEITTFMSEKTGSIVPENSWYLSIVGLAPEYQNKGLGRGLLEPVLGKTDELGVPTYLETFVPRSIPFYQRLGYTVSASFIEPVTKCEYWVLLREPHGKGLPTVM